MSEGADKDRGETNQPGGAERISDGELLGGRELAVAGEVLPATLHLLPLFERPFFPIQAMPLAIDEQAWRTSVEAVGETAHRAVGLVLVRAQASEPPDSSDFYLVGTAVRMHEPASRQERIQFVAEGLRRFRITKWVSRRPPYLAQVEYLAEPEDDNDKEVKAYAMAVLSTIKELIPLNPLYSEEAKLYMERFTPNQPSFLAYFAAQMTTASGAELQRVLEAASLRERMERVFALLEHELEVAKLHAQIRQQVDEQMSEQQRKFFLREQLKVIQKELGLSKDDRTADLERFRGRIEGLDLPEAVRERVDEELDKLSVLESGSPEYAVTRNYLDLISSLPWGRFSEDLLDLERAREILDADHDGLDDVKERIVEFLAVGKLRGGVSGSILLLVGPPGVGKTSIGRSVARALGRKFYRFSVGGMRDEAEIKGHRRTYIGALPGKPLQALKEVGTANPVLMLDEIDKIGASYRGDPASALLEVLDPEQNVEFLDHYLDVRFDLSRTLFICTANQLDTIPGPLLDRMEVIRLSGYIAREKVQIARNHLWPSQLEKAGVRPRLLRISDGALRAVAEGYAREAGVRGLDKQLARIVRKAAVRFARGEREPIRVGTRNLEAFLGKPTFRHEKPLRGVGVVTGLAWTALGGATLDVEATVVARRRRGFKLTGKLGEVMRESAEIAYSFISSNLAQFGGPEGFFDDAFVHLHVPEGATPKDGPSAGVTMATALLSLARGRRVPRPLAMSGELTLTGQVLAVGGIREKVIAARRVKFMELILPQANSADYEGLPEHLREGMSVRFASHYRDVFEAVFGA